MFAMWGDSIFKGVIYNDGRYTMPGGAVKKLTMQDGMHIKDYSVFGMHTDKAMRFFKNSIQNDGSSSVVLEFGGNDCDFNWEQVSQYPHISHVPKVPLKIFANNMRSMVTLAKSLGKRVYLCSLPPIYSPYYFDYISQNLNPDNILYWLGDKEHIFRHHQRYSQEVENLAKKQNTDLIDIRGAFMRYGDYHKYLCCDGIHPNALGQDIIYDVLYNALAVKN